VQEVNAEDSTLQLILDQLEELVVTLIEEIRERPAVAAAILAGVVGALVGSMLALNGRRRGKRPSARLAKSTKGLTETAELVGLGVRLLQNPIVRGFLIAAVERQVKGRLAR
jgi:hypothetical protein